MSKVYDVVIVGSGAGGGMMAYVLTKLGARVAIVEAGGNNIDHDIRHHQWPWELRYRNIYQPDPVHVRLEVQEEILGQGVRNETIVFDGSAHNNYYNDHFFVKIRDWRYTYPEAMPYRWVRVRSLGGKTNCWDAGALRWGPIEFKPYSYDGFGIDWPISYEEMAPWYARTEQLVGVSGETWPAITATPSGVFQPPPELPCPSTIMKAAARRMGHAAVIEPRAIITRSINGRSPCHYCGRCNHGCDTGAKFTSVGALLPQAAATGRLTILPNCIAREISVDSGGRASGVSFIERYSLKEGIAKGRYIVLSASAIETARILLNSRSKFFPNGLANSTGQVGRNLVEDTTASVSGYLPTLEGREVVNEDSYNGGDAFIHPFVNIDSSTRSKDFLRRYIFYAGGGFGMSASLRGGRGVVGRDLKDGVRSEYGSQVSVSAAGCGLEDANNYVDVDPSVNDGWGIPAARIHLRFGQNQQAMVRDAVIRGSELIEAAGGKVLSRSASPSIPGGQIHEQGTCRMGNDPRHFVTNRWGQCHEVPNLVCADGSIHCTSGVTNPTLTILTLSMRNAYHLAEEITKHNV